MRYKSRLFFTIVFINKKGQCINKIQASTIFPVDVQNLEFTKFKTIAKQKLYVTPSYLLG